MTRVSVREARGNLQKLLERVAAGEEVAVMRQGKEIARIVRPGSLAGSFPDLAPFRASIKAKRGPLSKSIVTSRREARY